MKSPACIERGERWEVSCLMFAAEVLFADFLEECRKGSSALSSPCQVYVSLRVSL